MTCATSVPILVFLGLSVLDLGPMYATDRQTDVRQTVRQTDVRQHHRFIPRLLGAGHNKFVLSSNKFNWNKSNQTLWASVMALKNYGATEPPPPATWDEEWLISWNIPVRNFITIGHTVHARKSDTKMVPSHLAFGGHSRSSKMIKIDRVPDFLLAIHGPPYVAPFPRNSNDFRRKHKFSYPYV